MKKFVLCLLLVAGVAAFAEDETVMLEAALKSGGSLDLVNVNGNVTIHAWDQAKVKLKAVKSAKKKSNLARCEVTLTGKGDKVEIRAKSEKKFMGSGVAVAMEVWVPANLMLKAETTNGDVTLNGVHGNLRAETTNGSVTLKAVSGTVRGETTNGDVHAALDADDDGSIFLGTTNGSIELETPSSFKGDLKAHTTNGTVSCDLPIETTKRSRKALIGQINGGGAKVELDTTNGSISISGK